MSTQKDLVELETFKTVLLHCLVIISFPIIAFFGSKIFIFDGLMGLTSIASNVYAAGVAVLILHVALGVFIYKAYMFTPSKIQAKAD